ncbi:dolichyl-diphosphooligosaccharide---protein glycotransferase [Spizellomyces sp. 'palustris']|nr:dolichyl-diphosphooligosaccharide---protein glycotransferase [Spizellomyces sp. 'palustris']
MAKSSPAQASPASPAGAVSASAQSVAASASNAAAQQAFLVRRLVSSYKKNTPQSLKLIDMYLVFVMLTGIIQFVYVLLAGTYPYNSFLAGFGASVGSFVLAANLRMQVNPENKEFKDTSTERAFADFAFASLLLFGFVVNFLG